MISTLCKLSRTSLASASKVLVPKFTCNLVPVLSAISLESPLALSHSHSQYSSPTHSHMQRSSFHLSASSFKGFADFIVPPACLADASTDRLSTSIGCASLVEPGISDFETIRTEGYAYVDKSRYAALLSKKSSMTLFIRPRRQGKTLMLNTGQCLLERKEELFRGLAVHDEVDWNDGGVPVITMDLSKTSAIEDDDPMAAVKIFKEYLREQVRDNAERLEVEVAEGMADTMFTDLLKAVSKKTGKKAAVLIDEYDAPLLQVLAKNGGQMDERVVETRAALHTFLLRLKSDTKLIHCQVVMGATKFTLADMLSQLNHLDDITHDKRFGEALGFTWAEIEAAFGPHVETLAGSRNETVAELRAEMERRYGGYCYDGFHKVFNTWDVSRALQKEEVKDYWLSFGFGGWLGKLLVPNVAPALHEDGVIIPELGDGNKLDKGLFEAMRSKSAVDEQQAWRALLQAGYLTVVEKKEINDTASLVLKPPNERVAAAVVAGIFDTALRNALVDDDLVKLLTDTDMLVKTSKTYLHGASAGTVQEKDVQGWYAIAWRTLKYNFVSEQLTNDGRADFVIEGTKNTHVVEFGMVEVGASHKVIKSATTKKFKQVRDYVVAPKNGKPIRYWVAIFSKAKGELVNVKEA
mmetsp:Transcript_32727/g.72039  ORF Transcript_32727/g.72039 Transcript_32727/m.72039 type:complete len:637 (+) Transcript_32727:121-2031(+)|eukprot:CAMPEP_0173191712 /NCGR_PEP_ID=MMETSP1141-20130122/13035_1 /TAXON_ID=483371 /ORGANISM="non described non described, Strain CCMP2298" /LENGTH=636 /DNA_ID=CAMNT_0014115927 /DNA_START=46 /DNA_END=1956 /DNA_ORIENTATION=+